MTQLYRAYGMCIASELSLPLPQCTEPAAKPILIELSEFSIAKPQSWDWQFTELPTPDGPCRWELQTLDGDKVVSVEISPGGERLCMEHCQFVELSCLQDIVLHPLLAHLARRNGFLGLHASVVEIEGRALALLGDSGEGKSTLARQACLAGAKLVSDDVALLQQVEAEWQVLAGPTWIRLEESQELQEPLFDLKAIPWPQAATRKWEHKVNRTEKERHSLAGLVLLETLAPGAPITLEPVRSGQQLVTLLQHRFGSKALPESERKREFEILGQVARAVPVMKLSRPPGAELLAEQVELLRSGPSPAHKTKSC